VPRPPQDRGGIYGYADFLAALRDPQHERHDEMVEWSGGEFDPEEFDLKEVNGLRRLR
jgi:Plasmid pRiA4b ORF-3-like protein